MKYKEEMINLADAIIISASSSAKILNDDLSIDNDKEQNRFIDINIESLCFYLHFINRLAYAELKDPKRGIMMDALASLIIPSCVKALLHETSTERVKELEKLVLDRLNLAEEEYSQYKFLQDDENMGPKGTLIWEFSKKITSLSKYSHNPEIILKVLVTTSTALAEMPFKELIKSYGNTIS